MDMYKLKFTKLQLEIFRLLCIKTGISLNQRQIAKFLKVSPTAIAKALPLLEKESIIKINRNNEMNLNLIELNRDNKKILELKRIENLKILIESNLINFLEESFPGSTIILFGSFSKGDDITISDIDIAIIEHKRKNINLEKYKKLLEKDINLNFYPSFKGINRYLKSNILSGILLSGEIEI